MRRRHKLKAKAEEEKYAPEPFIADAICKLAASEDISAELLEKIRVAAVYNVKVTYPTLPIVMQKYAEKLITDFLTPTTMEIGNE